MDAILNVPRAALDSEAAIGGHRYSVLVGLCLVSIIPALFWACVCGWVAAMVGMTISGYVLGPAAITSALAAAFALAPLLSDSR